MVNFRTNLIDSLTHSQLWIDRVCRVNLGFNKTICDNLDSNPAFEDYENQVQQQVAEFNIIGSYIENVPTIIISLYLGNLEDYRFKSLRKTYLFALARRVNRIQAIEVCLFETKFYFRCGCLSLF